MDASNNTSDVYMNEDGRNDMVNAHQDTENAINMDKEVNLEENARKLETGMSFDTIEELFEYYVHYGNENGFPVKRRSSKKGEDGEVRYVSFACSRSGKTESTSRNTFKLHPITKTGCDAKINAGLFPCGKWKITSISLDHNHELSPGKSRYYKKNRTLRPFVKRRLEMNDRAGIKPNKNFNSFVVEAGGHDNVPFLEKDCRNYLGKVRQLRLGEGDAAAIQNYFMKMQADNSSFYSLMDLDSEGRVKNIFWADPRSRAAYEEFGDVITFDTTYLTNKYDMPFAPFVGVNHHGQSILLGCALLSNENTSTFTWVFRTWLDCMGGRAPNAIITDQDRAMQNAIAEVFPNIRHRWCLWHILKKVPEKLGSYKEYESIKSSLHNAVYDSLTIDGFEESWDNFIIKYKLSENDWLIGLYNERRRWVPVFVKDVFWAGMSTTQRSESMNAFFDGYVNSKTTLKQFVEQYENALRNKAEKENHEDFNSFNSWLPCISHYKIEKQFQDLYTTSKFKEFRDELTGKLYCNVTSVREDNGFMVYEILEDMIGGKDRQATFTVCFDPRDCDIKCNCHLFEFRGILCRHSIVVLIQYKVQNVSEKYIVRRWRKNIKRSHTKVKVTYFDWMQKPENKRFDKMCNAFYQAADLATDGDDKTRLVMDWIKRLTNELSESGNRELTSLPVSNEDIHHTSNENGIIRSPLAAKRKGRPPETRKQPIVEKVIKKKSEKKKKKVEKEKVKANKNVVVGGTQENAASQVPTCGSGSDFLNGTSVFSYIQGLSRSHDPNGGSLSHGSTLNPYIGASYPFQVQDFDGRLNARNGGAFHYGSQPTSDTSVDLSLQTQGYHYPFWSGGGMQFNG